MQVARDSRRFYVFCVMNNKVLKFGLVCVLCVGIITAAVLLIEYLQN